MNAIRRPTRSRRARGLVALVAISLTLSLPSRALADELPPIALDPPIRAEDLVPDLAAGVVDAVGAMLLQDEMSRAFLTIRAWVARVPGDPHPHGLYLPEAFASDAVSSSGEQDLALTVGFAAAFFGTLYAAVWGEDWPARAAEAVATLEGIEQVYEKIEFGEPQRSGYILRVESPFFDFAGLEVHHGTYVVLVEISGYDLIMEAMEAAGFAYDDDGSDDWDDWYDDWDDDWDDDDDGW